MKIVGKFSKYGLGIAIVHIDIIHNNKTEVRIVSEKFENNFSQGNIIFIPDSTIDFQLWTNGAILGAKYALQKINSPYLVEIEKIEGLISDTNMLLIAIATITGIWDFLDYSASMEELSMLDEWANQSWDNFKDVLPSKLLNK